MLRAGTTHLWPSVDAERSVTACAPPPKCSSFGWESRVHNQHNNSSLPKSFMASIVAAAALPLAEALHPRSFATRSECVARVSALCAGTRASAGLRRRPAVRNNRRPLQALATRRRADAALEMDDSWCAHCEALELFGLTIPTDGGQPHQSSRHRCRKVGWRPATAAPPRRRPALPPGMEAAAGHGQRRRREPEVGGERLGRSFEVCRSSSMRDPRLRPVPSLRRQGLHLRQPAHQHVIMHADGPDAGVE